MNQERSCKRFDHVSPNEVRNLFFDHGQAKGELPRRFAPWNGFNGSYLDSARTNHCDKRSTNSQRQVEWLLRTPTRMARRNPPASPIRPTWPRKSFVPSIHSSSDKDARNCAGPERQSRRASRRAQSLPPTPAHSVPETWLDCENSSR